MALIRPFRAVRYDEAAAGALETLVAPPYDVLDDSARAELLARNPHNVVHLTLPESEEDAARTWRDWLAQGVLVRDGEPSYWVLVQDYVGPDGVARTRTGLVASLRVEPYETGTVLPHERTHRGPKEGRLRLVRATGVQLEPIFLLYDGATPFSVPDRPPDLEAEGAKLWRLDDDVAGFFADRQLLIADGHHRYETAVAFHEQEGTEASAFMPVVLVSTEDPGVTIFPTHRVFSGREAHWNGSSSAAGDALAALERVPADHGAFVEYDGRARVIDPGPGTLAVQVVDELGHEGLAYTPDAEEAVRRVDAGEASVAYLLRPTRIEDVFAAARRGEVLPQKTTFFYPKLLSGLLFHPVD
jgi:uncharacterized protein (DUF1015 family)